MGELPSDASSHGSWFEKISIKSLSDDTRRAILERVKNKLGYNRAIEVLDISKGALHNYLTGARRVPDEVISRALRFLDEKEFNEICRSIDRLRAVGIIREDGSIDYSLVLQAIALASRDEYLKNALLQFTVAHFKEDLRKMLGISYAGVKLVWDKGFEDFLVNRKKRRRITDPETLKYYRNLFKKHLEGRELSEELIDYVVNHSNKWIRNVFRHYIQYLYYQRKITPETFGWLMEIVPSRSYKLDVRPYPLSIEEVFETLAYLRESHEKYYLVYRLMLEGGLRLSHSLMLIESYDPGEEIEIPNTQLFTKRLVCFENKGFCRYYLGVRESAKPCEWVYFSTRTLRLLEKNKGLRINRRLVLKYARNHGLVLPKMIRKAAWRLMIQVMPREVARFIQSRFGELKISEARYEDLLSESDNYYPRYLELLNELEKQLTTANNAGSPAANRNNNQ